MKNEDKTREQLISELAELQQRITELELAQQNTNLSSAVLDPSPPRDHFTSGSRQSFISNQAVKKGRKYHISELIDISLLQQLLDSFYEITGIRHAFFDVDTNIISRTVWSDICLKFHRVCPQTEYRCKQSDNYISNRLQDGPYIKYRCLNGLIEYATPIIVEGQHLATIFMGQLLHEPPDEEYFRQQAREFGFDEEVYIEALHEVSIVPEDGIKPIMVFFSKLAQILASMGLERLNRIEAAEDNFMKAFHSCPDPVTITNFDTGYYVDVNYAWVETTGYQKHETVGRSVFEFDAYSCLEERNLILKEVQEKGYARNLEISFRIKSGDMHTFLISIEIIFIDSVPHLLSVYKDITERKRMEEQLRFSEECFSKAFNTSPILMALTTLHEGKIIKINDAFCNILGYSREETVGKSILELGIWSNPADRYQTIRSIIAKQSVREMEIRFNKKNGQQRQGLFYAEGLEIDGEQCIISVLQDTTDLKLIEAEMTRLDRLNVVGEIAASIGHEIRNPMTTVRGYLQLLQQNKNYFQEMEYFDLMIEELDRANSIITEFLSLAKNKAVELEPTNLNRIISKLQPLVQAKAMSRDQHIKLELSDLPDLLLDGKEIRQLILNLINNGLESMSSAGCVTIKTLTENGKVLLAVQDQGHGIDNKLLSKLGTPFLTTKEQGTGLGLAVCYRIANRHNASIDIDTGSAGTTFYVSFPINKSIS